MRNLILCLAFLGCNDDNLLGGMSDLTVIQDLTVLKDMAMRLPDGVSCGNMTCNAPQVCCVKPGMGGTMSSCVTPGTCGDGGADAACPAGVDLNAQILHTKLCHTADDCLNYMGSTPFGNANFDGCCTSTQAPGIKFCAPLQFMGANRYTCN